MIEIAPYASGSRGNCYRVTDGRTPLLLECGIKIDQIRKGCGYRLSEIKACLISHEHF
jgi:phosphoribosyl 1,2-cyclic phosphodiesterase